MDGDGIGKWLQQRTWPPRYARRRQAVPPSRPADRLPPRLRSPGTALSRCETEILALVADGLSHQAVGDRLPLTEGTVKSHPARVYAKLGVDPRIAAVATLTGLGLIRR